MNAVIGIPRFVALCRYSILYKLMVHGNFALSNFIGAIFPSICLLGVSVSRSGNSCNISNFFCHYYYIYGDL